jgi:hypothetical protein
MRSRMARRFGLAGSLLPAETTLTSADESTRSATALDGIPPFALTLHVRRYCPAPTAMLSPTTAQDALALATATNVKSAKVTPLNRDSIGAIEKYEGSVRGRASGSGSVQLSGGDRWISPCHLAEFTTTRDVLASSNSPPPEPSTRGFTRQGQGGIKPGQHSCLNDVGQLISQRKAARNWKARSEFRSTL